MNGWTTQAFQRARTRPLLSLVLVLVLVVSTGAIVGFSWRALTHDDGPHYPKAWDARIAPLAAIASQYRGLTFAHPVYVDFLSDKDFDAQVTRDDQGLSDQDRKEIQQAQGMLRALGLIPDGTDLLKAVNTLHSSGIIGLYSFDDKRIRVRGTELTPAVKVTLVHELTHVLQDQHFDLDATFKKIDNADSQDSSAFDAIVEGDARRIESKYRDSLPPSVQAQLDKADRADGKKFQRQAEDVPSFLVTQMGAPYALGEIAVTRAVNAGGNGAVDSLFTTPPTHQIHMLQPWHLGNPWIARAFTKPTLPPGAAKNDSGEFGALDLYLVLAERIPAREALAAADGWSGDAFVSYTDQQRTCVAAAFTGQEEAATHRIEAALTRWAAGSRDGASVHQTNDTVTLTACEPAGTTNDPADRSEHALELLAVRNSIEMQIEKQGAKTSIAACFAQAAAQHLSLATLESDHVSAAQQNRIRSLMQGCAGGRGPAVG